MPYDADVGYSVFAGNEHFLFLTVNKHMLNRKKKERKNEIEERHPHVNILLKHINFLLILF